MENKEEIKQLKAFFKTNKEKFTQQIDRAREQSVRHIISKGKMFNMLPFENELFGFKVKGKQIEKVQPDAECFIYYFDAADRIILIETYLKDWTFNGGAAYYYNYYEYNGDTMTFFNARYDKIQNAGKCFFKDGLATRHFLCYNDEDVFTDYTYHYDKKNTLQKISMTYTAKGYTSSRDFNFYYDPKGNLQTIQTVYDSGGVETAYTTLKINWKKLEQELSAQITEVLTNFVAEHPDELFSTLAIDCYTGHGYMTFNADTPDNVDTHFGDLDEKERKQIKYDSPADWEFADFAGIDLPRQPFDDKDTEKILQLILKIVATIVHSDTLKPLKKTDSFTCIVFDHNANVLDDYPKLKKTVKEYPCFKSYEELMK